MITLHARTFNLTSITFDGKTYSDYDLEKAMKKVRKALRAQGLTIKSFNIRWITTYTARLEAK